MYEQTPNKQQAETRKNWFDSLDMELIFMNAIAICTLMLAIVAADVFIL